MAQETADRIYYDESAILEFTAEVTAIRELGRTDGQQVWQIALDRTAFYPTSGGQPFDTGRLVATARSGASLEIPVLNVEEDDDGEVWHTTTKPVMEGTQLVGSIDASRRMDHTQQHSGQHLLSAILNRDFGNRTVSFHLGDCVSTIDLEGPALTAEQLAAAAAEANRVVTQALPLSIRYVSAEEAQAMQRQGLLRKLPPRAGDIRLVEIPQIDLNACGGTHVATTAEIGPLLLRGTENVRGNLRLAFLCGQRAINAAQNDFELLQQISQQLTTAEDQLPVAIERVRNESKRLNKERAALLEELAAFESQQLAAAAAHESANGKTSSSVVYTLPPHRDAIYARLLASHIVRDTATPAALILYAEADRTNIVLAAKNGVLDCGTLMRESLAAIGLRGGGNREMAQGAVPAADAESLLAAIKKHLP